MILKSKSTLVKTAMLVLLFTVLLNLVACSKESGSSKASKTNEYKEFEEGIDEILSDFSINLSEIEDKLPIAKEFNEADAKEKSAMALELAKDMAIAEAFGLTSDEIFVLSAEAVKAYPHPLLLNNFGVMAYNHIGEEEGLHYLLLALNQEPDNPILLTNIANIYMEMDDFPNAEEYVKRALQTQDDYGPAYQVMTTIHLKNENSILASETMIKSAKHCFDDVTMYHFDSFLSAVDRLDPLVDEYPLKEEFIDLLYTIAKENVDTLGYNSSIDTPEAQLELKAFPQITSIENLSKSSKYIDEELSKIMDLQYAGIQFGMNNPWDYYEYFHSYEEGGDGVYPVKNNIRQAYAYEVIESFYKFKVDKIKATYSEEDSKRYNDYRIRYDNITKAYDEKFYGNREKLKAAFEEIGEGAVNIGNSEDALLYLFSDFLKEGVEASKKAMDLYVEECEIELARHTDYLDIQEQNSNSVLTSTHNQYNEIKQVLEEYWLKSSGILKYISEEGLFLHYVSEREVYVYDEVYDALYPLSSESVYLIDAKNQLYQKETLLQNAVETAANMEISVREAMKIGEYDGGDVAPNIERQELSTFPEDEMIGDLQIEGSFFGLLGGSISFDGESLKLTGEILSQEKGYKKNFYTGETTIHTLTGVNPQGNTDWFKDSKVVKDAISKTGSLGKVAKALGKIGFGFSNSEKSGTYYTMDSKRNLTDRGIIHSKAKGGQIFDVGKSSEVVVEKSFATGLTRTSASTRYSFKFISISE